MKGLIVMLLAATWLGGCASTPPEIMRDAPLDGPSLAEVKAKHDTYLGQAVLWGGTIARTENRAAESLIEVVERPLQSQGRPYTTDSSNGRFLVRLNQFVDPAIYAPNREITVVGRIEGVEARSVGGYELSMPLIAAERIQLWTPRRPVDPYVDPYYYDPFWPYYRPYPYWYPYPYRYYWR